jgi:SAM-dependent methyltransferase
LVRKLSLPFRHYVNNHFEMVKDEVRAQQLTVNDIGARIDGSLEQLDQRMEVAATAQAELQYFVSRQLADLRSQVEGMQHELGLTAVPQRFEDLRPRDQVLANRMVGHDGYQAQLGLWVNDPLSVGFEGGSLRLNDVNERIVEIPYVLGAVTDRGPGARVLDVGCCESTVALHLASLGYRVTALDPRPYPFAHPNLTVRTSGVEAFTSDEPFDAVVLLSTIEHLGVGSYGLTTDARLDLQAMRHIRTLLAEDGRLVLTTPFGRAAVNELERTYDVAGIHELLDGYRISGEPQVAVRIDRTTWEMDPNGFVDVTDDRTRVVMLTAQVEAA